MEQRFIGILSNDQSDDQPTNSGYFQDAVRSRQEQRKLQIARIASNKGFTLNEAKDLNIYEYYLYVEEIILQNKEAQVNKSYGNGDRSPEQIENDKRLADIAKYGTVNNKSNK